MAPKPQALATKKVPEKLPRAAVKESCEVISLPFPAMDGHDRDSVASESSKEKIEGKYPRSWAHASRGSNSNSLSALSRSQQLAELAKPGAAIN